MEHSHTPLSDKGGMNDSAGQGKKYWKSLDELADSSKYREYVEREFPESASELLDPVSRRSFLGIMASSMALAGVGCQAIRRPEEHVLAYNQQPENVIPGKPLFYSSAMSLGSDAVGLLVESHSGRPTKIEGHPTHTSSMGYANRFHQASILQMYDPERSQKPKLQGQDSDWNSFMASMAPVMVAHIIGKGKGLSFLTNYQTSPSASRLRQSILARFPEAKWYTYESIPFGNEALGLEMVTSKRAVAQYQFEAAKRIASFDSDFLGKEHQSLIYTKGFSKGRDPKNGEINRLYVVESDHSITGARSDHRLPIKQTQIHAALASLTNELLSIHGLSLPAGLAPSLVAKLKEKSAGLSADQQKWISALARDLVSHKGESLVCVGKYQDAATHALAFICNFALTSIGKTVSYTELASLAYNSPSLNPDADLQALTTAMQNGEVETLVMVDVNPVYSALANVPFAAALAKVKNTLHFGLYIDETAAKSLWHLPASHALECWNDATSFDGLYTLAQPLIVPLYDTRSSLEFLALWAGVSTQKDMGLVRETLAATPGVTFTESSWQKWVHDGSIGGSQSPRLMLLPIAAFADVYAQYKPATSTGIEVLFREDASVYDGRFAGISWLQEFPDPMTRLTWDNAALMGPSTAKKLGVFKDSFLEDNKGVPLGKNEVPMVKIVVGSQSIEIAVYILPGIAADTIVLNMGYGRTSAGKVGNAVGFSVSALQSTSSPYLSTDAQVSVLSTKYFIASVQEHWSMEGRDLARIRDVSDHSEHEEHEVGEYPSLHSEWDYSKGMQWGMAIDLNKCTGCGHCVIACQAENNIPVVGKKQVSLNREMSWIRLDRYFVGDNIDEPSVAHQPVGCQHCELAPCETVCPVAATVHSTEGLNDMVYNRCIGTRYCSNNCPYKVRRFNFFNYNNHFSETEKMGKNPDVTVRFRGVMEKCSYCVQRINVARNEYKLKGIEMVPEGAIVPACVQTCPADAIAFGNINDSKSKVLEWKKDKRNYDLLAQTNARPRTSYLARLSHTNPELASDVADHSQHGKAS